MMKISHAIQQLKEIQENHGDLDVAIRTSRDGEIFTANPARNKITYMRYAGAPDENPEYMACALIEYLL